MWGKGLHLWLSGVHGPRFSHLTTAHQVPVVPVLCRGYAESLVSAPASNVHAGVAPSARHCARNAELSPSNAYAFLPVLLRTLG